ncbi:hypothetical protein ATANTOWER_017898 [Ataeniobius toweri]|uniref:Uncharacterized protein n=1 Tax=Ataeniobius toweri TaxID=208326 RepID=A0ABU7CKG0_9TELE|nr:hypothetical protein [Ataeniobius toweri]
MTNVTRQSGENTEQVWPWGAGRQKTKDQTSYWAQMVLSGMFSPAGAQEKANVIYLFIKVGNPGTPTVNGINTE